MKKTAILVIVSFVLLVSCCVPAVTVSAATTKLSGVPFRYSRISSPTKASEITSQLKKDAVAYHNKIIKCTKSKCKTYVKNKKYGNALLTFMFGKYLYYIRSFDTECELEFYPNDSDLSYHAVKKEKKTGKWYIKIDVKTYKKLRKHNNYIRKNVVGALKTEIKFPPNCTEQRATEIISDWICGKVQYDYSEKARHNIWYTFRDQLILCMGYADTFQVIANEVGINTWIVGSDTHEFNRVVYDGKVVYVDTCWQDGSTRDYVHLTADDLKTLPYHDIVSVEEYKIIKIAKPNFKAE